MKRNLLTIASDSADVGNKAMLEASHQLYKLADSIDWGMLQKQVVRIKGSRYKPVARIVCSALYLNVFYELSSADVIEKWSSCPYHRYFCSGESTIEDDTSFPISQFELDTLIAGLDGECHAAMIKALLVKPSETIH